MRPIRPDELVYAELMGAMEEIGPEYMGGRFREFLKRTVARVRTRIAERKAARANEQANSEIPFMARFPGGQQITYGPEQGINVSRGQIATIPGKFPQSVEGFGDYIKKNPMLLLLIPVIILLLRKKK